jgi:hypothetical protein
MARLLLKTPGVAPAEIHLMPGCNRLGREGENDFLVQHTSVSRRHCEVWLTEDAVLVRDLGSRNGTFVEAQRVQEAQISDGQTLRLGDVEMVLAEAPVRISVPDLPIPATEKEQLFMPDGTPCCFVHGNVAAGLQCTSCFKAFCTACVRELRLHGGVPHRFCPECGAHCEPLAPAVKKAKRSKWLEKLVDAFTKPPARK